MNLKKGFTLIELLVVVAIIGILASVVLASLNTARTKGSDAAIKANLTNTRAQAAIYYDLPAQTYSGVCAATTAANGISAGVQAAATAAGVTSVTVNGATQDATTANCNDTKDGYAASVKLKSPTSTTYFCVDSSGSAMETATPLAKDAITCTKS